jgi:hypothetical protein
VDEAVAQACFEDKPTMIDPGAVRLSDVIADEKKRARGYVCHTNAL